MGSDGGLEEAGDAPPDRAAEDRSDAGKQDVKRSGIPRRRPEVERGEKPTQY